MLIMLVAMEVYNDRQNMTLIDKPTRISKSCESRERARSMNRIFSIHRQTLRDLAYKQKIG